MPSSDTQRPYALRGRATTERKRTLFERKLCEVEAELRRSDLSHLERQRNLALKASYLRSWRWHACRTWSKALAVDVSEEIQAETGM